MTLTLRGSVLSSIFEVKRLSALVYVPVIILKSLASSMLPTMQVLVEHGIYVSQSGIPISVGDADKI